MAAIRLVTGIAYADRIYPGVSAAGVDLSGRTVDEASVLIGDRLAKFGHESIRVRIGDSSATITADDLGFRTDTGRLAQASYAVGRDTNLLMRLLGPFATQPRVISLPDQAFVDDTALAATIDRLAAQTDRPAQNAHLDLSPAVLLTPSRAGQALDRAGAQQMVRAALLAMHSTDLDLPVTTVDPTITTDRLSPLRDQAERLVGGPVVLTYGQQRWLVPSNVVHSTLTVRLDPPALDVSADPLHDVVEGVGKQVDRPAVDAGLTIHDGVVDVTAPLDGRVLDRDASQNDIRQALLAGNLSIPLTVRIVGPAVSADDVKPAATEAQKALERGLVLTAGQGRLTIAGADLANLLRIDRNVNGQWSIAIDDAKLRPWIDRLALQVQYPSLDARFSWDNGKLTAREPKIPGFSVDPAGAIAAVDAHWREGTVDLPFAKTTIVLDDASMARLNADLKDVIAERQTSFVGSIPERATNIAVALSHVDGTLVAPGVTFSFNRALGPTTLAAGFRWGFGFSTNDKGASQVVPSVAGGICQVATTVFQPVFWSGYTIEERHWHLFAMHHYAIDNYLGLDATVSPEDNVDFQFTNDSDHALLIHAWTQDNQAHVALIGTKPDWTVKVDPEQLSDVKPPPKEVVRSQSPLFAKGRQIILEDAGEGVTSRIVRHVIYPDGHERTLKLESIYQPAPKSILVGTGPA